MLIGICDDFPAAVENLYEIVENYIHKNRYSVTILKFFCGTDVIHYQDKLDILFLDIEMPEMDGIEVGKQLCKEKSDCKIIIATNREERFKEAFKINAFRFVSKPFEAEEIEETLEDALSSMLGSEQVELYENRILYSIRQKDICYVEAYESYIEVMLRDNRKMRRDISLGKMQELMDERLFYRINRRYLVNMDCIENYDGSVIEFGNLQARIPRVKKKEFERIYKEYRVKYR